MKILLCAGLLFLSAGVLTSMEKKAGKKIIIEHVEDDLRALTREEMEKSFKETMKREHGREILQNACPIHVSMDDNPELFNQQTGKFPDSKSFFDAKSRLLTIVKNEETYKLIDPCAATTLLLNTPTQKVFRTQVDVANNILLVLKTDKTEPYTIPMHKSLVQVIDLATGNTLSEAKYEMPYGINNIAYDHEHKRVYLATAMLMCGGDSAGLWKIDQNSEKALWISSDSISNSFTHLACLPHQSLLTVQEEGLIKEWDFSQADHSSKTLWRQSLDSRFESLLPGEPIHADLSADQKDLLVGVCQPYSRFFLLDLEKARDQEKEIKLKRMKGQEANPQYFFSHDILDTNDARPITALKLLPCKTKFVAVRAALKKKMPMYPIREKKDPVDYTVQLWSFDGDFYRRAPLAEFTVYQSPSLCKVLSVAPDGSRVAENNMIWDISLLARIKEILKNDMLLTADEYDAIIAKYPQLTKDAKEADNQFNKNPNPETYAQSQDAKHKSYSAKIILPLLKLLDQKSCVPACQPDEA